MSIDIIKTIEFLNALRRGEKPSSAGKGRLVEASHPLPSSDGDREAVRVMDLILRKIALSESIARRDWLTLGELTSIMHAIKGIESVIALRQAGEGIKAADMKVATLVKFLPLRIQGKDLCVGIQARLSEEFLEFCLQMAYSILVLVEGLPKVGRPPIGVCRKCGDLFAMVYYGKPKRFCSIRCKSLFRSMKHDS